MAKYLILFVVGSFALLVLQFSSEQGHSLESTDDSFAICPKQDYQTDLKQLIDLIDQHHPLPHAFMTLEARTELEKQCLSAINESTTTAEFLWMCRSIVAGIGCGHSNVSGPNERLRVPADHKFPIEAQFFGTKLFVIDPRSNSDRLSAGVEILTINGRNALDLRTDIHSHISADGYNRSSKHSKTNQNFGAYAYYSLGFPKSYRVEINDRGRQKEIELHQPQSTERKAIRSRRGRKNLEFHIDAPEQIAVMTIRSFGYYGDRLKTFKSFIDDCFSELETKNVKNLVIDIRGNSGGDPYAAAYLLQHLSERPFIYFDKKTFGYKDLKVPIEPNSESRFSHKPYVLIDGNCFSTSGHLSSLLKHHKIATLIGSETGGTFTCNDNSRQFRLKKTGLKLYLARTTFQTSVTGLPNDRGILPDIEVKQSLTDTLNNEDTVLKHVMALLKQKQQP